MTTRIIGIDPGLVHTGAVRFNFDTVGKRYAIDHQVFEGEAGSLGPNLQEVFDWVDMYPTKHVFIEAYRPRANYNTDSSMSRIVTDLKRGITGSKVINNTGVKAVIRRPLMDLLEAWTFTTRTHHQDLRSAARIGLYGLVKDKELNRVLFQFTQDMLQGNPWGQLPGGE